jgi:sulfur-oxidizing protein SoxY
VKPVPPENKPRKLRRRALLQSTAGALGLALLSRGAPASPGDAKLAITDVFGDRELREGRVAVKIPPITENGYTVPLLVDVESPMSAEDHVVRIGVFAEENPLPLLALFELGQRAGRATVQTRIRMADSQRIVAVAEMNNGSLWWGHDFSIVTLGACVI